MGIDVGLNGNHSLDSSTIDQKVSHSGGAYALGVSLQTDGGMPVKYVGRSDSDLNSRLKQHASEGQYSYFAFTHRTGAIAAYEKECELYHTFGPLDNVVHPHKPNASCKCPHCGA